jgi:hypothetical protein
MCATKIEVGRMSIDLRYLCGTWECRRAEGQTIVLAINDNKKYAMTWKGGPAAVRAAEWVAGDQVGDWSIINGDELVLREDVSKSRFAKLTKTGWMVKAVAKLEDAVGIPEGKREYEEIWTIRSLTENELDLAGDLFHRVTWKPLSLPAAGQPASEDCRSASLSGTKLGDLSRATLSLLPQDF